MPRIIRLRYHINNVPEGTMSAKAWLTLLRRDELIEMHEWCEPWPLLWTLTDREVVNRVRRCHPVGPVAFLKHRDDFFVDELAAAR